MTKEERKAYEGKRIVGKPFTELYKRSGFVYKVKKNGTITIVFDDAPGIKDDGYLFEEVDFV